MQCKHCGESRYRKDGTTRGKQRYFCKSCRRRFIGADGRTVYSDQQKLAALALYKEGVGFRGIGRFLGISYQTILRWTESAGEEIRRIVRGELPETLPDMDMIVIDEMWHYTQKNKTNYGYGLLYLPSPGGRLPSKLALVALNRSGGSGQGLRTSSPSVSPPTNGKSTAK